MWTRIKNAWNFPKPIIKGVCETYINKFDECVSHRTVPMAKRANAIREQLVKIINTHLPAHMLLRDTGDIGELRRIIATIA